MVDEKKYEWYENTQQRYVELEADQQNSLDKHLLTVSAAALGFSVLIAEKILENNSLSLTNWSWDNLTLVGVTIILSWIALSVSIIATIWSFKCSAEAARSFRTQFNENYKNSTSQNTLVSNWPYWVDKLNWTALVTFTLGIVFLLVFSLVGLFLSA